MREIMTTKLRVSGFLLCVAFVTATSCGGLKVRAISATTSGQVQAGGDPREDPKKAFTAQFAANPAFWRAAKATSLWIVIERTQTA